MIERDPNRHALGQSDPTEGGVDVGEQVAAPCRSRSAMPPAMLSTWPSMTACSPTR